MNNLSDKAIADLFFDGDEDQARGWLKAYRPPRIAGLLVAKGGKWVRAFGPTCSEKNLEEAYLKAPFEVHGHWIPLTAKTARALNDISNGVAVAVAAKRHGVVERTLYRALKAQKQGQLCPTCGRKTL